MDGFQMRMVLSSLPLARVLPSGLKAMVETEDVCPESFCRSLQVDSSASFIPDILALWNIVFLSQDWDRSTSVKSAPEKFTLSSMALDRFAPLILMLLKSMPENCMPAWFRIVIALAAAVDRFGSCFELLIIEKRACFILSSWLTCSI